MWLKSVCWVLFCTLFFVSFSDAGTLNANKMLRDPFLPVGYEPEVSEDVVAKGGAEPLRLVDVTEPERVQWDDALKKVQIAGVSRKGNVTVLIVNDRVRKVGSHVEVEHGGRKYTWRIDSIDKQGVLTLTRIKVQ